MSFAEALKSTLGYLAELGTLPGQAGDKRRLRTMELLQQQADKVQQSADMRASNAEARSIAAVNQLAPGISARARGDREHEVGLESGLRQQQYDQTLGTLNAAVGGKTSLMKTAGDLDLQRLAAQGQFLDSQQRHELGMAGKFIGEGALVPQLLETARGMQGDQIGFMRELAQMNQPNTFERAVGTVGPLALLLAGTLKA